MMDLAPVLHAYGVKEDAALVARFGSGLIHHSWKVSAAGREYLLQKINHFVFKSPEAIAENIQNIGQYLAQNCPEYLFVQPVQTIDGSTMVHLPQLGYFRMFPFVPNSHSIDVVQTPDEAFEAAVQFGRFTRNLSGFDVHRLHAAIPHFHDLNLRYRQYTTALEQGNRQRIAEAKDVVQQLADLQPILGKYKQICANRAFGLRVTHHDTKISNVLFDEQQKGMCVIDLDTVMPGYFISDVGDMMRTYLSPVSEEEKDTSLVTVRTSFYKAIVAGYMQEMSALLRPAETASFFYAGQFMIYMQALRFITDYFNDDVYYGARYPQHNLVRARNQMALLQQLGLLEKQLNSGSI